MKNGNLVWLLMQLVRNMGLRYVVFRAAHELQKKTGWLKIRFPKSYKLRKMITLELWRDSPVLFFRSNDVNLKALSEGAHLSTLRLRVKAIKQNQFSFFGGALYTVTDWHTNPVTGFKYDRDQHWSSIVDSSPRAGDIKFCWEKSRFTFLYDLIRYDVHFQDDQSKFVFEKIENWIDANPVNCGPHWKCSQEITLRVLNWTFSVQFYKNSINLSEPVFEKIMNSIHMQMQHVEENINFSRIAVRNNHAITETLGLYIIGLLYPFFPESQRWKAKGRKWFEKEIAFQIYEDGTFLQFSMNYHRVVVQLLSWAIRLADLNGERFGGIIYERALRSVKFLRSCQDERSGWLPHYGNEDGALFFPFTECHYRDFRPQLAALANILEIDLGYGPGIWEEEKFWLCSERGNPESGKGPGVSQPGSNEHTAPSRQYLCTLPLSFNFGGYYTFRDEGTVTFVRCGLYKHRPLQADNLHLDIWVDGENIFRDAGSYSYGSNESLSRYFMGTASHNTVMLGGYDQMRKGPGFIWYDWIRQASGDWSREEGSVVFEGCFTGFRQIGKGIRHHRKVTKKVGFLFWQVEDWVENVPGALQMHQLWHPSRTFMEQYSIVARDDVGNEIEVSKAEGWYSEFYGQKQACVKLVYTTAARYIRTIIQVKPGSLHYAHFTHPSIFPERS